MAEAQHDRAFTTLLGCDELPRRQGLESRELGQQFQPSLPARAPASAPQHQQGPAFSLIMNWGGGVSVGGCNEGSGFLNFPFFHPEVSPPHVTESQNHRIVGVGRDHCGSSSPALLLKQGPLLCAISQAGWADLTTWAPWRDPLKPE